jgi:hypothetical protein
VDNAVENESAITPAGMWRREHDVFMPNGKSLDHPLSDIVVHGMEVYGPEIDTLIREVHALGGFKEDLADELLRRDPRFGPVPPDVIQKLKESLILLRDRLRREFDPRS